MEPEDFHLCMVIPDEGEEVSTFAYSKDTNFLYNIYDLKINNEIKWAYGIVRKYYPNGRDSYLLPGPCVETSMTLEAGLSGGPVINKNGQIIGVNSTSFTGQEKDISYFTPINPIANISFETESEGKKTKTTLLNLVN